MATKKYISLDKLTKYHSKVVEVIEQKDDAILASAKTYADSLVENYDTAGAAATVQTNLDAEIDRAKAAEEANKALAEKAQGDVDALTTTVGTKAAQSDLDVLEALVGELPDTATATDVVGYINEKTANIASDATVAELGTRVTNAEQAIDAIEADYLKAADKTELNDAIVAVDAKVDEAKDHSEGVATDLATAKTELEAADTALSGRVDTLEGQITGLSGAMHFKGVKDAEPTTEEELEAYVAGDVIAVGAKEYVFNGTEFVEFGDVSAEGERLTAVEGRAIALEADVEQAQTDIDALETAVGTKVEQSAFDSAKDALEAADTALGTRVTALEGKFTGEESVEDQIATAKQEAIDEAATNATTKVDALETSLKAYVDAEDAKIEARVDALEDTDHTHDNKALLDTYTQTESDLADAVSKKHNHENDAVLNGITSEKVTAWDTVTNKANQTALQEEIDRAKAAETANKALIEEFVECSDEDINAIFA